MPPFIENTTCRSNPCDDVALICGTEASGVALNVILGGTGSGSVVNCAAELGVNLPWDGVEIIGMDDWEDLRLFLGEKLCDVIGCFPPVGPAAIARGACLCYTGAKAFLNCSIAMSECEGAKLETPPEHEVVGACGNSSVMACVTDNTGVSRPTTDAEIDIQCRNLARTYRYEEPSAKFDECVANCGTLTRSTRDGSTCGTPDMNLP